MSNNNLGNQQGPQDKSKILEDLFKDAETQSEITLDFPSKGRFYKNFTVATLKPVSFEDEKFIISNRSESSVNTLLERCLTGINLRNLLVLDKMYVLLKLREISYGPEYQARVTCPACMARDEIKIDLRNLNINYVPDTLEDPKKVYLPALKKEALIKIPRVSDEVYLKSAESLYDNVWRFVIAIDSITDPIIIHQAIERMNIRDIRTIISSLSSKDLGIDPRFILHCISCGEDSLIEIPIGDNFFSVS